MALLQPPPHLKLCTSCIHYYAAHVRGSYKQLCQHPSNVIGWSLVDGKPHLHMAACEDRRAAACGKEGSQHETRASLGAPDSKSTLAALRRITADDL